MEIESDCDVEEFSGTPPEITDAAKIVNLSLLPPKSRLIYEKRYSNLVEWCTKKKIKKYSENVLLVYFNNELQNMSSSSLWSIYSMLRSTLLFNDNIDISEYKKLVALLKRKSVGYKPKKSKTFDLHQVTTFLNDAPDEIFLMKKVSFQIYVNKI